MVKKKMAKKKMVNKKMAKKMVNKRWQKNGEEKHGEEKKVKKKRSRKKASVWLHIPHCFVQMRARSCCPADTRDKDLGAKANKGKQGEIS